MTMRCGILTFTYGNNYGQRLQNYAMQYTLLKYFENVLTIPQKHKISIKLVIKQFLVWLKNPKQLIVDYKRQKAFNRFNKKNISFYKFKITENRIPKNLLLFFDVFVVGSDQVWSPYSDDVNATFFLTFAPYKRRICYAPSIGTDVIPYEKEKLYIEYLKGFEEISIREYANLNWIEKATSKSVTVVLDPTLLLDRFEWDRVIEPMTVPEKYILIYTLGDKTKIDYIKTLLKDDVIIDLSSPFYKVIGPERFLFLIKNANLVITDSYHGTIFSIIFHVPFVIVDRDGTGAGMKSRFDTLERLFDISNRHASKITRDNIYKMDFDKTDAIIKEQKIKSIEYLERCINRVKTQNCL